MFDNYKRKKFFKKIENTLDEASNGSKPVTPINKQYVKDLVDKSMKELSDDNFENDKFMVKFQDFLTYFINKAIEFNVMLSIKLHENKHLIFRFVHNHDAINIVDFDDRISILLPDKISDDSQFATLLKKIIFIQDDGLKKFQDWFNFHYVDPDILDANEFTSLNDISIDNLMIKYFEYIIEEISEHLIHHPLYLIQYFKKNYPDLYLGAYCWKRDYSVSTTYYLQPIKNMEPNSDLKKRFLKLNQDKPDVIWSNDSKSINVFDVWSNFDIDVVLDWSDLVKTEKVCEEK